MLALAPQKVPQKPSDAPSPATEKRGRVAILQGCAEPVLRPEFREATVRLLNRCGIDVTFAKGEVCCGALVHHMGREEASLARSEEHTSELQSLMRISYAVFCLKTKKKHL